MESSIEILKKSITKLDKDTVYATDDSFRYFLTIRSELESIANGLVILLGKQPLSPDGLRITMQLMSDIDNLESLLAYANKNSSENVSRIINVRDIRISFKTIKNLMLHPNTNEELRKEAIRLFLKTGNLYSIEQIQEFIGWLNDRELKHVLQVIEQESTLMEKYLTNSPIHVFTLKRINLLKNEHGLECKELTRLEKEESNKDNDGR